MKGFMHTNKQELPSNECLVRKKKRLYVAKFEYHVYSLLVEQ